MRPSRLTSTEGIVSEDFLQEAVKLLHVLHGNVGEHATTLREGLLDILSQDRDQIRRGGQLEESEGVSQVPQFYNYRLTR